MCKTCFVRVGLISAGGIILDKELIYHTPAAH